MKTKILIVFLVILIIVVGVLFVIKFIDSKRTETATENSISEVEMTSASLEKEKEVPKSKYENNERTYAVVIDNVGEAIPQTGLNQAMIVYEVYVEGGLTRFLALIKGVNVDKIGPVRSARPVFIDYALENDSIFVHFGGSPKALNEVETLKINNISGLVTPSGVFWRSSQRKAPHNALTSTKNLASYAATRGYRTTTTERNVLNYVLDEVTLEDGIDATTIDIPYSSSPTKYVYNAKTGLYERYYKGTLSKDWVTGETIATKNIIITYANNYSTDEENGYGRQSIENIGQKDGYYITNGKAVKIKCEKKTRAGRTVYKDLEGNELKVNDANTWIQIVPTSMKVTIE